MRILVTNDDGVAAPGLAVATEIAQAVAGPGGEVWVVAPAFEQSGVSHAISFTSPVKVEQLDERRFAVAGTPADCVILALHAFMKGARPDLVLSGVNRGHNVAEDAVYSGTVGGAIEGALKGLRAVALSQYFDRARIARLGAQADMFEAARHHGADVVRRLLALDWSADLFFNVNFPPIAAADVKGARYAAQGRRRSGDFECEERVSPGGRPYYWLRHRADNSGGRLDGARPEDHALCADGWITMAPMRPDYTATDMLDTLAAAPRA